jgi:opacity protein-like surface antigen
MLYRSFPERIESMKKLLALVFSAVLLATPAMAGQIESPGFAQQQGEAPTGYSWALIDGLWFLMSL